MQSYLIERNFGHVTPEQLQAGGSESKRCAAESFADTIVWRQSHATETPDGLVTYCLYEAASEQHIRDHAASAGLPCDKISAVQVVREPAAPDDVLRQVVAATGGTFRHAPTTADIAATLEQVVLELASDGRDFDGDGLSDCEEINGYFASSLGTITSDPRSADTDQDDLTDGDEVHVHGVDDTIVPMGQSEGYVVEARAAGARAEIVRVEGDHFAVIDPTSQAWDSTLEILDAIA